MTQPQVRCVEFVELVTEWMEGALDEGTRIAFEEHFVICPDCPEYVKQLRLASSALRIQRQDNPAAAPPPAAREALLEEFRRFRASGNDDVR